MNIRTMVDKRAITIVAVASLIALALAGLDALKEHSQPKEIPALDLSHTVTHDSTWPGENTRASYVNVELDCPLSAVDCPLTAGSYTTIKVTYTAGRGGIKTFGGVRVAFEHGADWGRLQTDDPKGENYVSVVGPKGVKFRVISDPDYGICEMAQAQIVEGKLKEGQTLTMIFGDRSGGSRGLKAPMVSDVPGAGQILVFEDRTGEGHFYEIIVIPGIEINASVPHHMKVIARSWAAVGEPVDAVLHVEDEFNNLADGYAGDFKITDLAGDETIGAAKMTPGDKGFIVIQGLKCPKEGIFRFKVQDVHGAFSAMSNPIECCGGRGHVTSTCPLPKTFFGSIHSHTLLSDGLNTIEGATLYARDISNLDFFAPTEHAILPDQQYDHVLLRHNIYEDQWNQIASTMRKFNNPGSFITFLGFEWSTLKYGDKNIYFFDDNAPYRRFPPTPGELYKSLAGERVTVITHTMMGVTGERGPNWDYVDNRFEKVMEIASGHGLREYTGNYSPICEHDKNLDPRVEGNLAAEVLKKGLRLGFVGGSDDHSGKPGAGVKGVDACFINALVAVRGLALSRETIFEGIQNRAVYATTGARILLDFSINGHTMGQEIRVKKNERRVIKIEAHGEAPVREVHIIRENPAEPVKIWKWEIPVLDTGTLSWEDNSPLAASTWYYVRVIQSDNQMAWSSPIWVDPETPH